MTKVVLNDVEYDTEDFTEGQNKVLAELVKNNSVKTINTPATPRANRLFQNVALFFNNYRATL